MIERGIRDRIKQFQEVKWMEDVEKGRGESRGRTEQYREVKWIEEEEWQGWLTKRNRVTREMEG